MEAIYNGADWWKQCCLEILGDRFCDLVADVFDAMENDDVPALSDYLHDLHEGELSDVDGWRWPVLHRLAWEVLFGLSDDDRRFVVETAFAECCGYCIEH